jgi:hypothetical protein
MLRLSALVISTASEPQYSKVTGEQPSETRVSSQNA